MYCSCMVYVCMCDSVRNVLDVLWYSIRECVGMCEGVLSEGVGTRGCNIIIPSRSRPISSITTPWTLRAYSSKQQMPSVL